MAARTSLAPVAHLTCVGSTITELEEILAEYAAAGVSSVLALRGDPAAGPGTPWVSTPGGIDHADELVALIRQTGDFGIGVAAFPDGHPESSTRDQDAQVLARKQDAGAEFAITQFFFRASDYLDLVERAAAHGCDMPIIPGLMPVTNVAQIQRFAALSGAAFPADLAEKFEAITDDADAVQQLGVDVATDLAAELLAQGAPGLHFYTLNRSSATRQVYEALTLRNI
jgi:methylenetetrahydrofolate reductase (NADPH)